MIRVFLLLLAMSSAAWAAYSPAPMTKSDGQLQFEAALEAAKTDSAKWVIAQEYLTRYPDDVAVAKIALNYVNGNAQDPVVYMQEHLSKFPESIAAHYVYARAVGDTATFDTEAKWILKKDPNSFWGHFLAADAEWDKTNPDMNLVIAHLDKAVAADPSQPEVYVYLGYIYRDQKDWTKAREAYEAGLVADPASKPMRNSLFTVYAGQRDADAYFAHAAKVLPAEPIPFDLKRADREGSLTLDTYKNDITLVEYWAFT